VLQCIAGVCFRLSTMRRNLQVYCRGFQGVAVCIAGCCRMLQCVAVCCMIAIYLLAVRFRVALCFAVCVAVCVAVRVAVRVVACS